MRALALVVLALGLTIARDVRGQASATSTGDASAGDLGDASPGPRGDASAEDLGDASPGAAQDAMLAPSDVLELVGRIPAECTLYQVTLGCPKGAPGHYERAPDAVAIAAAIAHAAKSKHEATEAAVFAAYEGAMRRRARGDWMGGAYHSFGTFQLQHVAEELADDPERAAPYWLALARLAETQCAANDPLERLAVLASGRCSAGRRKVRVRMRLVRELEATW
jgi:hypothetical protein